MSDTRPFVPSPELYNEDGCICALRIDGPQDTRGKALAFFASESGDPFTSIRVRRARYREWTERIEEAAADGEEEPYDGWPVMECGPGEPGAEYWVEVRDD